MEWYCNPYRVFIHRIRTIKQHWIMQYVLLFSSVILFTFSFPPTDQWFLAYFSLVPLYFLLTYWGKSWLNGLWFGVLSAGCMFYFILTMKGPHDSFLFNVGIYFLILALHGFIFGLFGFVYQMLRQKHNNWYLSAGFFVFFWPVFEFILDKVNIGFHLSLGGSQYNNSWLLTGARFIGIYGISAGIAAVNVLLAGILLHSFNRQYKVLAVTALSLLTILFLIPGMLHLAAADTQETEGAQWKICVIQANISAKEYQLVQQTPLLGGQHVFGKYMALSRQSIDMYKPQVVVWPEGSVNLWLMRLPQYRDTLTAFAKAQNVHLMIGCPDMNQKNTLYNSVFFISPSGNLTQRYDKNVTVPFTESFFERSSKSSTFTMGSVRLGVRVCYEMVLPMLSTGIAKDGVDFLLYVSNNVAFGYTNEPFIIHAAATFRAVENGTTIVHGSNNGFSSMIDKNGRTLQKTDLLKEDILCASVPLNNRIPTFFASYGNVLYQCISLCFVLFTILLLLPSSRFSPLAVPSLLPRRVAEPEIRSKK